MTNFLLLTKVFFLNTLKIGKKKNNNKIVGSYLLFGLLFLALSIFYNYFIYASAIETNMTYIDCVILALFVSTMLTLVLSLNQMQGSIFNTKDYELLESLPISKVSIVAAKIVSIFLITCVEDLIILLPNVIFYGYFTGEYLQAIILFICCLFIGLIPLLISSLVGALVATLTKKMKNKNIINLILNIVIVFSTMFLSFTMNNSSMMDLSVFTNVFVWLKLIVNYLNTNNLFNIFIFIIINIIALLIISIFIGLLYRPINNQQTFNFRSKYIKGNNIDLDYKKALLKKEYKLILGNTNLLINAYMGVLMFLIMGLIMLFVDFAQVDDPSIDQEVKIVMYIISISMGVMMNCVSNTTNSTISLEHKSFESLLSYPLDPKDIMEAKVKASLNISGISNLVVSIVLGILYSIFVKFDIIYLLQILILPHLAYIFSCLTGLVCNLKWPKLDYDNEMQVIKQSASVGFGMLLTFLPSIIISGSMIALDLVSEFSSIKILKIYGFIIPLVIFIVLIIIVSSYLKKKAVKLFKDIINK